MEVKFSGNPKTSGIIGLIIAILSLLVSIIPCIGVYGLVFGLIAFVFSLIAFLYGKYKKGNTGIPLLGLIISIIAISISIFQYSKWKPVFDVHRGIKKSMEGQEEKIMRDAFQQFKESLDRKDQKDSLQIKN